MKKRILFLLLIFSLIITFLFILIKNDTATVSTNTLDSKILVMSTDTNYTTSYYTYNLENKTNQVLYKKEMSSYPTGVLWTQKDLFFFTDKDSEGYDQLFKLDLESKRIVKLTDIKGSIDFLRLDSDFPMIYMRINLNENENFHIGTYDLISNDIEIWDSNEKDQSVKHFDFNTQKGQLVILTYSISEDNKNIDKANQEGTELKPATYHLIKVDRNRKQQKIADIKKNINDVSLSNNGSSALISYSDKLGSSNSTSGISVVNLDTGNISSLLTETNDISNFRLPRYSNNESGVFFLSRKKNMNAIIDGRDRKFIPSILFYYDLKTKQITKVLQEDNGTINNFLIYN